MKVEEVSSPTTGYRFPAEWEPHAATWLAWPHRRATFLGDFDEVPLAFVRLVRLLARYEPVRVIGSENPTRLLIVVLSCKTLLRGHLCF